MMRALSAVLFFAPLGCALAQTTAPPRAAYEFFLDDQPHEPPRVAVYGTASEPAAGDLVWIGGISMVLGDGGTWRFERDDRKRVWCTTAGSRSLAGLVLTDVAHAQDLTEANWRSLRGVCFESWNEGLAACLARLDAAHCHIKFGVFADFDRLPDFPPGLRYLDLTWADPTDLTGIERLTALRYLKLPRRDEVTSIAWIKRMPALCRLHLEGTAITDLTPLDAHPSLRRVFAYNTPLARLPTRCMPALEEFIAHSTGCPGDECARFRGLHAGARISLTNREALLEKVRGAARLRLREGSTCHPQPDDRRLYETDDAKEIARVVALLQMGEDYSDLFTIPGCEQHALAFLDAKGEVLLEVGMFGTSLLRCDDIWETEPSVRKDAQGPLRAWLRSRGARMVPE